MMIIVYILLIMITMLGINTEIEMNPQNDTNSFYVPKSKRGYIYGMNNWLKSRVNDVYRWIINKSMTIKTNQRVKNRSSTARKIARSTHNSPGRNGRMRQLITFSVLAMLADKKNKTINKQRTTLFDTDAEQIGIDNRCSACISHRIEDFIGQPIPTKRSIKGFGGTRVANIMSGTIMWKWSDEQGKIHEFRIPNSYYVPEGGTRLLSPQHWAQEQRKIHKCRQTLYGCNTNHENSTLYWKGGCTLKVPIDPSNNVATFHLAPGFNKFKLFCEKAEIEYDKECEIPLVCQTAEDELSVDSTDDESEVRHQLTWPNNNATSKNGFDINDKLSAQSIDTNGLDRPDNKRGEQQNLSAELLDLHQRYGHISFARLREMANQGIIGRKYAKCQIPNCSACLYAKATKRKWRDKKRKEYTANRATNPGECVSVDQLVSPTPGLVAQMTGILTTKRYKYATVFVDHATKLGYTYLQTSADADETIKAKRAFEEYAAQRGVQIRAYHADNGIFRANKWVNDCREHRQGLSFAGVNAHHQNGLAERRIRSLQDMTRAMLIHANKRWKSAITPNLWPYAMKMATDVMNETPNMQDPQRRSSEQMFSKTIVHHNIKHQKTFGCPIYVLENKLQTGKIYHKWNARSKVGIYLGRSPQHSRNVALVLDRYSGLVSPQFHVTYDNKFDTVQQENYESKWQIKAGFVSVNKNKFRHMDTELGAKAVGAKHTGKRTSIENEDDMESMRRKIQKSERDARITRRNYNKDKASETQASEGGGIPTSEGGEEGELNHGEVHSERSGSEVHEEIANAAIIEINDEIFCYEAMYPCVASGERDLLAFKTVADPDVMYMHQAMKQPDKEEFIKAMSKEVEDQTKNGNFSIVDRKSVPKGRTILNAVWQMRRKRDIKTREIKKYKARLNVDGSRMKKGIDYDETYAPVATWRTIRLLLTLASAHNWHTRQLDYVLAFPQAPVERELYMEVPKGFQMDNGKSEDYLLKIHRNIYGQKQAGRVWNQYLVNKLTKEIGFKQSKIDECLFYKGNVIYVLYTDDSLLAGPNKNEVDEIIKQMKRAKLDITDEGNIEDFLGVNIERRDDGSVKLSQPHLIKQIISDLKMDAHNLKIKDTPAASSKILSKFPKSQDFDRSFHYRSVIGKLNYLEKCTRPDIAYAAHQCARFTENPKVEHGKAVRWLVRYLAGTMDKGIIMTPKHDKDLQMFVDADFSGNWNKAESIDRDTARSRHGYVVTYNGCPLMWKSQLQTEIALSSTESEYVGISCGLRDVIPIMRTLEEMKSLGFPIGCVDSKLYCRVFEDNSGALEMAKVHKYRPRTKHMNVKYHHFRDYVSRGEVTLHAISTDDQPADMLTKPLNATILSKHRRVIMGW